MKKHAIFWITLLNVFVVHAKPFKLPDAQTILKNTEALDPKLRKCVEDIGFAKYFGGKQLEPALIEGYAAIAGKRCAQEVTLQEIAAELLLIAICEKTREQAP
jgi:hypothetical protein